MEPRSLQERVLIGLGALGAAVIFPFSIIRFLNSEWLIAIIDLLIAGVMALICGYVFRTRKVAFPSYALSLISAAGVILSVSVKGSSQIFWVYPAILAAYYLIKPNAAALVSLFASVTCIGLIGLEANTVNLLSISATLFMTNGFAYVFAKSMHDNQARLTNEAGRDPLTGCGNRRSLNEKLAEVVETQARQPSSICLFLLDLDYFKMVNDRYGHKAGDDVLVEVVEIINNRIRVTDALYRFGGEEFIIVPLPIEITQAINLAEELRQLVANTNFKNRIKLTISIGLAQYNPRESASDWLSRADKALYQAKETGRNKCCIAE
ncbi:GGDEF domain-containing protein [Aliikangiella sp. IMCC44653]